MSYDSICLMCYSQRHLLLPLPLSYPKKENKQPQEEIRNLNGFEYRYLNGRKVPYFCAYPLLSMKVISMGMTQQAAAATHTTAPAENALSPFAQAREQQDKNRSVLILLGNS